jgi:hypothetical protein
MPPNLKIGIFSVSPTTPKIGDTLTINIAMENKGDFGLCWGLLEVEYLGKRETLWEKKEELDTGRIIGGTVTITMEKTTMTFIASALSRIKTETEEYWLYTDSLAIYRSPDISGSYYNVESRTPSLWDCWYYNYYEGKTWYMNYHRFRDTRGVLYVMIVCGFTYYPVSRMNGTIYKNPAIGSFWSSSLKTNIYYYYDGEAQWSFDIPAGKIQFFDNGYFAFRTDWVDEDSKYGGATVFYNPTPETIALFNSPKAYISNYDIRVRRDSDWVPDYRQKVGGYVEVAMEVQNVGDVAGYILREIIRKDTGERLQWEYKWMEVGEKWGYTYAYFVMPANNVTLRFEAYHWDGSKWVSDGYREATVYALETVRASISWRNIGTQSHAFDLAIFYGDWNATNKEFTVKARGIAQDISLAGGASTTTNIDLTYTVGDPNLQGSRDAMAVVGEYNATTGAFMEIQDYLIVEDAWNFK